MVFHLVIAGFVILGAVFGIVNERSVARRNDRGPRKWLLVLEVIVIVLGTIALVLAIVDMARRG